MVGARVYIEVLVGVGVVAGEGCIDVMAAVSSGGYEASS